MRRLLKVLGIALGVLAVIAIAVPLVASLVIDPNDYRDQIARAVEERTGRSLRLDGDLRLTFYPWLGVESGPLELGNAPGFGEQPFARLESARVRVRLLPLLRRELEMDTVSLEGLELNLARDASGRGNWEDLAGAAGGTAGGGNNGSPALAALAIGGVELRDAALSWNDERGGQRIRVSGLELKSGPIEPGRPLALELGFDLDHEAVSGRVEVRGELELDPGGERLTVRGLTASARLRGAALGAGEARLELGGEASYLLAEQRLRIERLHLESDATLAGTRIQATLEGLLAGELAAGPRLELRDANAQLSLEGEALPGGRLEARVAATLRADLGAGTLAAPGLRVSVEPLELGTVRLSGIEAGGDLAARLDGGSAAIEGLDARAEISGEALAGGQAALHLTGRLLAEGGRVRAPGLTVTTDLAGVLPGQPLAVATRADLVLDLAARRATLSALEASAAGIRASGDLVLDAAAASLTGKLTVQPFAPRALLARLGVAVPVTADPKALGLASLRTGLEASAAGVRLAGLDARLDGSRIRGALELPAAAAGKRQVRFDLAVDRLALDRYLPPVASGSPGAAAPGGGGAVVLPGAAGALATLPLETLRALTVDGRVRVGELTVRGARLRELDLPLRAEGGLVRLGKASARLYGGRLDSELSLDARGKALALAADERLAGVGAAALLAALGLDPAALGIGKEARLDLSGRARVSAGERVRKVAVETLEVSGRLRGKGLAEGGVELAARLAGRIDLDEQTATVPELGVRLAGVEASGKLAATGILTAPRFAGTLEVAPFDPRATLAALGRKPPPTADPKALTRASLKATLTGSPTSLRAEGLELTVDETRVSGVLEITDLRAPGYRFDLDVDRIDADRYLPPRRGGARAATPGAAAAALPLEALRRLDLEGELRIGELRIGGLRIGKVRLKAKAADGKLRLNPLEAALYQGRYRGDIRVDASGRAPRLSANERLSGVQIGALLEDLQGRALISGRGELALRASARGARIDALKRTLDGRAEFRFTDGAIYGIDLLGSLCRAFSVVGVASGGGLDRRALIGGVLGLAGQAIGGSARPRDRTEFAELAGSVDVRRGLATNRDLVMRSPLVRVEGAGEADLARDRIRYTAKAALVASCRGQGGPDLGELRGLPIPVRLTGRLSAPTVQWPGPQEIIAAVRRLRGAPQPAPAAQAAPPAAAPRQAPSAQAPPPPQSPRDVGKQAIEQILQKGLKGLFGQ